MNGNSIDCRVVVFITKHQLSLVGELEVRTAMTKQNDDHFLLGEVLFSAKFQREKQSEDGHDFILIKSKTIDPFADRHFPAGRIECKFLKTTNSSIK